MFYTKCKCGKSAGWQLRVTIPISGGNDVKYVAMPQVYCQEHRKAGIKATELLDEAMKQSIIEMVNPAIPDFDRAFIEWCPWK